MYSKIALSIGGSDSVGGAGIQADLRTFMALKVHGCSVITCITAQNSIEVTCVEPVEKNTLLSQLDTLFSDFSIDALKTGMLLNERIINDTASTHVTSILFCAVMHVITEHPCTLSAMKVRRSAWIPAPPPESLPPIESAILEYMVLQSRIYKYHKNILNLN